MLDIAFIRSNPDVVKQAAKNKGIDVDIDKLLEVDERRRKLITTVDELRARRNELSSSIPKLQGEEKQQTIVESKRIGAVIPTVEAELNEVAAEFDALMYIVPSVPAPEVPIGEGEEDNQEVSRWGAPRTFDFPQKDHIELATSLGLVDFEGPRRFAGSRSYALKGDGVFLEQAVLLFTLQYIADRGATPVSPPVIVKENAMLGTGYFPLGYEEAYRIEKDGLYLCGTSEVGLVSLHYGETLNLEDLPIRYGGISPCFRREAGAAGRDTKGLYRVHQFMKVEQVVFCENDEEISRQEHYRILANAQGILEALKLPHRVALACTKELGLGQVRKHEVETWMPSRNTYSETHSCSTLHDFQARRSNIRYRDANGKLRFVHTLNNTAIASPRILIAILENYQNEDGSVTIPEVLQPYMRGQKRIEPVKQKSQAAE
jgi:seryl-tRNA synthetase